MKSDLLIPDGGWGWVIVICSFLIHMFVVGTMYALSVLYVEWLEHFGDGKGMTSWIISLAVAVMFGIAPVPGSLSKRFGNRAVVIMGGFVMSTGFIASYFAMNVYFLAVSVGIVTGTGAGCCYLPSVSMVAMYFTTKRSVAMGIAASGLGAGAFCMAPLLHWLVDYYGWRGCMLILAGISLNMCVLGAMMRPLENAPRCKNCPWIRRENDGEVLSRDFSLLSRKSLAIGDCGAAESFVDDREESCKEMCRDKHQAGLIGACRKHNASLYRSLPSSDMELAVSSVAYFPAHPAVIHQGDTSMKTNANLTKFSLERICDDQKDLDMSPKLLAVKTANLSHSTDTCTVPLSQILKGTYVKELSNAHDKLLDVNRQNGKRKLGGSLDILTSTQLHSAQQRKQFSSEMELRTKVAPLPFPVSNQIASLNETHVMLAGSISSIVYMERTWRDVSLLSIYSHNSSTGGPCSVTIEEVQDNNAERQHETYCSKLLASLNIYIRLLQNRTFLTFSISNFLTNLSFFMPVLYMVDRALDSGMEKGEAAMLISLYGVGNICGKLFFGWLADRKLVDRLFYYIACLTVCGVSTCMSSLCGSSQELHSVYAFVFGCFIGAYVTLVPIVTVDLMGLTVVAESFGLLLCFMGVATVFGTPVAGWIFDWTGSYAISFILHGVFILLSAFMLIPLLVLKRRQRLKQLLSNN